MSERCPACNSPSPDRHPAMQFEGEVELCTHDFHLRETNQNRPENIACVLAKRAALTNKAREFLAANKLSKVVAGAAMHIPGEDERPENVIGCRYTLDNGRVFSLKSADLRSMPPPEWVS